jgi:hypothetical protein
MNKVCGFCNKPMEKTDHTNKDMLDVYLCAGCIKPDFDTRFRQVFYPNENELLATQFRLDEFHVVMNYAFNYTNRRTRYTTIYKKAIGFMYSSLDLEPLTWDTDHPVHDFDTVLQFPFHDPALLKRKLQLYTLFS